jgi:glycosyltransferase involved in cell wall biosynthesis
MSAIESLVDLEPKPAETPATFRPCVVVPTYDNAETVRAVVVEARRHVPEVIVVDDGSHDEARRVCARLADEGLARVTRRAANGGKGAAVKTGLDVAASHGFTHAFQVDADGQHDLSRMPAFLEVARARPDAVVLAYPSYDASVPRGRLVARRLTTFWVNFEVGGAHVVEDAMVGFRVYPLARTRALRVRGNRMDFDVEIAVRIAWAGIPIVNLPVGVRYLRPEEGGRSHFQPFRDNLRFAWLHSRLCTIRCVRWFLRLFGLAR